jgi:hypothetical protein
MAKDNKVAAATWDDVQSAIVFLEAEKTRHELEARGCVDAIASIYRAHGKTRPEFMSKTDCEEHRITGCVECSEPRIGDIER